MNIFLLKYPIEEFHHITLSYFKYQIGNLTNGIGVCEVGVSQFGQSKLATNTVLSAVRAI
jgi:hypothetical protein